MRATILNCTLKSSPGRSDTEACGGVVRDERPVPWWFLWIDAPPANRTEGRLCFREEVDNAGREEILGFGGRSSFVRVPRNQGSAGKPPGPCG
jgi:hypothetical protein